MRTLIAIAALTVTLSGFATLPALAQSAEHEAVLSACLGDNVDETACNDAVALFIASTAGMTPKDADAMLANLVIALASSNVSQPAIVAAAINSVASAISDPVRSDAATKIAQSVSVGTVIDATHVQTLASPT